MRIDTEIRLVCAVAVALIALLLWLAFEDGKQWEAFKAEHYCKVVAHIKGDVFNTFGTDARGNMTVGIGSTPDKTVWLCDDGVTYYR